MSVIKEFRLPDVGEGLTEAEIVTWRVAPGDQVAVNDVIVEIETAKSLVELPVPFAGEVSELLAAEGATVPVGTPIIRVAVAAVAAGAAGAAAPDGGQRPAGSVIDLTAQVADAGEPSVPGSTLDGAAAEPGDQPVVADVGNDAAAQGSAAGRVEPGAAAVAQQQSVLVGYGPREGGATRRRRAVRPPAQPAAPAAAAAGTLPSDVRVLAKPPVRKLARNLGIDLTSVTPSGAGGVVTREDVEAAALAQATGGVSARVEPGLGGGGSPAEPASAFGAATPFEAGPGFERERRVPIRGVRKSTAEAMVTSAFTAPQVTAWVTVDVTRSMKLLRRLRQDREFAGLRVSPLLLAARALVLAVRRNPGINATWDEAAQEIVLKNYVNLGVAAATPRGLVVPNIKDAHALNLRDLAEALGQLTAMAREGRTTPADTTGGTITITNIGVFGVDSGTPLLNRGESAILCLGQVRKQPWVHKGKVKPRWVTQLSVTFDHRLVDGDLGSKFLADVAAVLERPAKGLVWS